MEDFSTGKPSIRDLLAIYSVALNLVVYLSSFFFTAFLIAVGLEKLRGFKISFAYLTGYFLLAFIFFVKIRNKKIKEIGSFLGKVITIFSSLSIVLLFLNSHFKIIVSANRFFSAFIKVVEPLLESFVVEGLFTIGLIPLFIYLVSSLTDFFIKVMERSGRMIRIILVLTLALLVFSPFAYFVATPSAIIVNNLTFPVFRWILGFSLISIHLNYLYGEIRKLVKN